MQDSGTVFANCAARTRDVVKRHALLGLRPHVETRAALYLQHADAGTLFQLAPQAPNGIAAADLSGLYDRALVKGGERPLYLRLRQARFGRCPLCAHRDVKTLDHYLPKDSYPELSVMPANLLPSCWECNHAKLTYRALTADQLLFHPYFDDWRPHRLVRARVAVGATVEVTYAIRSPEGIDPQIVLRARRHFEELDLATLYAQQAAVELVDRKQVFRDTYLSDGAEGLEGELAGEARSRRRRNRNSWQSALYRALSRSEPFCQGGFELIEEP